MRSIKPIEQVQREVEAVWMALPGVFGVGIGQCGSLPCFQVLLEKSAPRPKDLPWEVDGYRVETAAAESPRALDESGK